MTTPLADIVANVLVARWSALMPLLFNDLLTSEEIDPRQTRLVRHQERGAFGRTPFTLWSRSVDDFDRYQSIQSHKSEPRFRGKSLWASFVVTPKNETLFVGLYDAEWAGPWPQPVYDPLDEEENSPDRVSQVLLERRPELSAYIGRLVVEWGVGYRSWVQSAARQSKPIVELRRVAQEPAFPGYIRFVTRLSDLEAIPAGWIDTLAAARGVYLLSCSSTGKAYVGAATGVGGFFARWREYAASGHGNNVGLRRARPSDYVVSILEVAGSAATTDDIFALEAVWKRKLLSREFGFNEN